MINLLLFTIWSERLQPWQLSFNVSTKWTFIHHQSLSLTHNVCSILLPIQSVASLLYLFILKPFGKHLQYFRLKTATQLVILPPHVPWNGQGGGILLLSYSMICVVAIFYFKWEGWEKIIFFLAKRRLKALRLWLDLIQVILIKTQLQFY